MSSLEPDSLKLAVAIEPRNVIARYRLAESLRLVLQDDDAAAEQFEMTLREDRFDCATLLSFSETERARLELAHAAELRRRAADCNPSDPRYQITLANSYFVANEPATGLSILQRALRRNPEWRLEGFETAWRAALPIEDYLSLAGSDSAAFKTAFEILLDHNDTKHFLAAARRAHQLGMKLDDGLLLPAVDNLLGAHMFGDAREMWSEYASRHPEFRISDDDSVSDPTFAAPVLNRGFGWKLRAIQGVSSEDFAGRGLVLHLDHVKSATLGLEQTVLLTPGAEYELSAQYSSDIVSVADVQLGVQDLHTDRDIVALALHAGTTQNGTAFRAPASEDGAAVLSLVIPTGTVANGTLRLFSVDLRRLH